MRAALVQPPRCQKSLFRHISIHSSICFLSAPFVITKRKHTSLLSLKFHCASHCAHHKSTAINPVWNRAREIPFEPTHRCYEKRRAVLCSQWELRFGEVYKTLEKAVKCAALMITGGKTRITASWLWASTHKINTASTNTRNLSNTDVAAETLWILKHRFVRNFTSSPGRTANRVLIFTEPQKQPNWMLTSRMS